MVLSGHSTATSSARVDVADAEEVCIMGLDEYQEEYGNNSARPFSDLRCEKRIGDGTRVSKSRDVGGVFVPSNTWQSLVLPWCAGRSGQ